MTTHTNISLRSDDRTSDLVSVEVDMPVDNVQRVRISIGVNSIHMNWTQFEEFMKVCILKSGEEYHRRDKERVENIKKIKPLNLTVGDSLDLKDSLG